MATGAFPGPAVAELSWPFVGRAEELEWMASVRRRGAYPGALVSGAAGVGKTRLAREALAAARGEGAETEWVQATRAAASIPLGAFAGLVPVGVEVHERLQLLRLCSEALRERGGPQPVVLGVDDAHLLDPASAALVLQLATSRTAFVVATVRTGERCPDSIVALWKDLEVPRLELQQLSEDETAALLERALGGELSAGLVRWAFGASEGHVLYLRELVKGALADGALVGEAGRWRLRSQPAVSPALRELIAEALEGLGGDELDSARLLALGEPLELDTVSRMTGLAPLAGLEARGLAIVAAPRTPVERGEARLSHPLYSEVVRAAMPRVDAVELRKRLAEAVRGNGLGRPGDALRVATWLEEAGAELDEPLLMAAARDANAAGAPTLAERLARRAPEGPERALVLGRALLLERRFAEAEAVLAAWEGAFPSKDDAVLYLEHRALRVLHVGLKRSQAALALLARAESWFGDEDWRDRVGLIRGQVLLTSPGASSAEAVDALDGLLRRDDLIPELRRRASIAYALSLYEVGRISEARVLAERLRPTAVPLRDDDDAYALVAWWAVRLMGGYDWEDLERWLEEADRATARSDDPLTRGEIVTLLACTAMRRGKPVTAARRAREAIEVLERSDSMARLPLAWLCLATSAAMQRDRDGARAALAGYDAAVGDAPIPYLQSLEVTARAELALVEGETSRAVAVLLDAAAAGEGDPLDRATVLHEALRAGADPRFVIPPLEAATRSCDAPLVGLFRQLAAAMAARDGDALVANAKALDEIGASLWAAETAALAALAYKRSGREDSARRALALSARFRADCEDVWSPLLASVELAPAALTRREREIASLAASGVSNAEIAGRLVLSIRTVESHLYRAMRKLGINTRRELENR